MATCLRCKRGLTDPGSIRRGFGPVCWAKKQAEEEATERKDWRGKEYCGPYDGGDIILERRDGTAFINVPEGGIIRREDILAWLKRQEVA